ncbi:MAG: iron complex outermembrane recepter protein [Comamonadaceae bacterium]|nr:MAG: iron complex outermembrane recepter protein [Comamonadaceae bacterium]
MLKMVKNRRRKPSGRDHFKCAAAVIALCCSASSQAAVLPVDAGELVQLSLDDLLRVEVQSASRYAQPLADSPASVTVIDQEELRRHSYRNLAEALSTVRGVYLSNDRNYSYLGVRGFNRPGDYNSRILLLTDGARRNDALYDQAQLGNEAPIEIDWVKRLEFVSGPSSAVYGANALFGSVNAVMLDGADIQGIRLSADTGSGASQRLGLMAGQRVDGEHDWFFALSAYDARGNDLYFPEFATINQGWARGLDGESYQKAYGKYRFGNWRLSANLSSRDKHLPNAPYQTAFNEPGTHTVDQHALLELAYDGPQSDGWQQQFRIFSGSYRYRGDYMFAGPLDNRDTGQADGMGADYRLIITTEPAHKLMLGLETQWNTLLAQRNFDLAPAATYLDNNHPVHTYGIFVQEEWRLSRQWLLNLGLRYDKHSDYVGITSPRVALIYQASEELTLKAMVGNAYRAPNAYERFYDDGGVLQKANPALQPEHIRSVELAADVRVGQGGRVGLSLYRNDMRDMIDQVLDPLDGLQVFMNQSSTQTHGIELDAEKRWPSGQRVRASLSRQWSSAADGSELGNSPRWLGKLVFAQPVAAGWTMAGEWLAMSERRALVGYVAGYGVLNLTLTSAPMAGLGEFSLGVFNVSDSRYHDPASSTFTQNALAQEGRQFRLSWTLRL